MTCADDVFAFNKLVTGSEHMPSNIKDQDDSSIKYVIEL